MKKDAYISDCGKYRYWLTRDWDDSLPRVCFVMLNPSTADASNDDPTIRKCMAYARAWGCGGIDVRNLFPLRTPSPSVLIHAADPLGDTRSADQCLIMPQAFKYVIAAWGVHGTHRGRDSRAIMIINRRMECLGRTKAGHPKHPLYLRGDVQPAPYFTGAFGIKEQST